MGTSVNQRNDWRSVNTNIKVTGINTSLNEFQLLPTGTEIYVSSRTEFSSVSIPRTVIHIQMTRGTKIVLPFGDKLKRLAQAFHLECDAALSVKKSATQCLFKKRCIFVDDLRRNSAYNFSTFVPTGLVGVGNITNQLPSPYEIIFSDCDQFASAEAEEKCATMTWTFPEPRQPVRLMVNPVPFIYTNDIELENVVVCFFIASETVYLILTMTKIYICL